MNNKKLPTDSELMSPCISVCRIDPVNEICLGCFRTRGEIASWSSMNKGEQSTLLDILGERRAARTGVKRRRRRLARDDFFGALGL